MQTAFITIFYREGKTLKKRFLGKVFATSVATACAANLAVISNFATAQTNIKVEFEDGTVSGGADIVTETKEGNAIDHSGSGFVWLENAGETVSVKVTVEEAGVYDLKLSAYTPYGSKQQALLINDEKQGDIALAENKEGFQEVDLGNFKLAAGENTISIQASWGWIYVDYITVSDPYYPELNVKKSLSDKKATDETKRLMSYLVDNYGSHIISGQQEIYMYGPHDFEYEFEYIKNLTGVYPAIRGFDYLNECNILYGSEDGTTSRMIDWATKKNGIVTASWHVTVPKDFTNYELGVTKVDWGNATYVPKETDFDTANAVVEGTKEYEYYMKCLESLASSIKKLQDANVPIILRPLHEAEGGGGETNSWFWWGKSGSAVYKQLWQLTYKTLTETYGLHNIIWEWNSYAFTTSRDWYPGDEYVDIVAYDKYSCSDWSTGQQVLKHNDSAIGSTFYNLVEKYDGKKLVAMAENDNVPTLSNINAEKAAWLYFCTWYDGDSANNKFLTNELFNKADDLKEMYQSDYCISLDEIPEDFYNTYSLEGFDEETPTTPTEPTTEPVTDPTEVTSETTEPATDPTEVTSETTEPATDPTEATSETTEPVTDSTEATDETQPTTESGNTPTVPADAEATLYGDVDNDGKVTSTDLVLLNKFLLSTTEYPLENKTSYANADCELDQIIDLKDSGKIINYILGIIGVEDLGNNSNLLSK